MTKKILVPTDFSKNAWNALTYALDLFKDQDCVFHLLNAYNTSVPSRSDLLNTEASALSFESDKATSEKGLAKILDMVKDEYGLDNHSFKVFSVLDDPQSAIDSLVEKMDIQLIVMGTKGVSDYDHRLFGTNTINVMEKMRNCPTLGIPREAQVMEIKEIVFPTSYRTHYKRRELIHMVELAQHQKANICALHISDDETLDEQQNENKALLADCLEGASFSFHHLSGADTAAGVKNFVESRGSDMVAFINSKHSFMTNLLTTPLVKELGMFSKVPLLVMHDLRS